MTIKLDENTRGIWYCQTIPGEQDFLLSLRRLDDERYKIDYRFRYYHSDDPFDEEDKKSWYMAEIAGRSEEEIVNGIRIMFRIFPSDFIELLRGDRPLEEFMEEFMEQDFVHAQYAH